MDGSYKPRGKKDSLAPSSDKKNSNHSNGKIPWQDILMYLLTNIFLLYIVVVSPPFDSVNDFSNKIEEKSNSVKMGKKSGTLYSQAIYL